MSADMKVKKATAPKKAASATKKPAPKSAAAKAKAETTPVETKPDAKTASVKAQLKVKAQPKAVTLPKVLAKAPKLDITTDNVIARAGACLEHPLWGQINGPVLVEFKKFEESGVVSDGTAWAVKTAEGVLKGMAKSAVKAAEVDEANAWIATNGAEVVLRAITCTKSAYWEGLRKPNGKHNPPLRRMFLVEEAAAGRLTPTNISVVYDALTVLEKVLQGKQSVVVHNGRKGRLTEVGDFAGVKGGPNRRRLVTT